MSFLTPSYIKIRDDLLRDIKNLLPDADISTDSDHFVRASSVASAIEGLYQHQEWIVRQIFPDTADTDYLEMHASLRNIIRKPAVSAGGKAVIWGEVNTNIEAGTQLKTENNQIYLTTADAVIGPEGQVELPVKAMLPGASGTLSDHTPAKLLLPKNGLQTDALLKVMLGGTDIETDTELLNRLLEDIRRPPAGGNKYDYRRWALSVPGVTDAYVYPLRRGLGTVDVIVTTKNGIPSAETMSAVYDYIDLMRPVTAKSFGVISPSLKTVDFDIAVKLDGNNLDDVKAAISEALQRHFESISPGSSWVKSQAEAMISNIPGVVDRRILSPASNMDATINSNVVEWLRIGDVNVREFTNYETR